MQNIGSTFKHFGFFNLINQYLAARYVYTYADLGIFISFSAFAETPPLIPMKMMLNNSGIEVFSVMEPSVDLGLHSKVDRADDLIKLFAFVALDGKVIADESSSKEANYRKKLGVICKNCVDFFKHHFQFFAWTIFGFICGYWIPANVKWLAKMPDIPEQLAVYAGALFPCCRF